VSGGWPAAGTVAPGVLPAAVLDRLRVIRRRVRLESGRPHDGRCGKVAEAIEAALGWAYRWGHLRLLDGWMCWIHCWNRLPDGTVVDATADQFEERWLGDVVVLPPGHPLQAHYRPAPPGHLFRTMRAAHRGRRLRLLVRGQATPGGADGDVDPVEEEVATAAATRAGWAALGACAVELHSGWRLPAWIGAAAGDQLRAAAAAGRALSSRELEFALDAAARQRRIASHGEWTSPEWREVREIEATET
jgi:hypothetical protein